MISIIAAVDRKRGIGYQNRLLFWLPLDEVNPEEFGLDSVREGVRRFLKEHKL